MLIYNNKMLIKCKCVIPCVIPAQVRVGGGFSSRLPSAAAGYRERRSVEHAWLTFRWRVLDSRSQTGLDVLCLPLLAGVPLSDDRRYRIAPLHDGTHARVVDP